MKSLVGTIKGKIKSIRDRREEKEIQKFIETMQEMGDTEREFVIQNPSEKDRNIEGEKIIKTYAKWEKINNQLTIFPLILILAYELKDVRTVVKYIVRWLHVIIQKTFTFFYSSREWFKNDWAEWVVMHHYYIEFLCLIVAGIGVLSMLILKALLKREEKKTNHRKGGDDFEERALIYLNKSDVGRCFLLSGEWGSGKTFKLNQFLNKYYSKTSRKIYRISCFGLNTRKDVIDELSKVIGNSDNSPMAVLIKLIEKLPIIGELLSAFLKKGYGYSSVKKGSIFVFDDFERLASPSDMTLHKSVSDSISSTDGITEELHKHLIKIDEEKYLSMIGVINEMIEVYRYKVIIVCNTEMLGEKFVSDVLRSKLNCVEYRNEYSTDAVVNLTEKILKNFIPDEDELYKELNEYLTGFTIGNIFKYLKKANLRIYVNLIEILAFSAKKVISDKETYDKYIQTVDKVVLRAQLSRPFFLCA